MGKKKDLDKIVDSVSKGNPDSKAYEEEKSFAREVDYQSATQNQLLQAKIEMLLTEIARFKEDTALRNLLAKVFTVIIAFWLLATILILVGNKVNHYDLSEKVLITLLTTTTLNVIGMMHIILKNLFPNTALYKKKKTA